MFIKKMISKIIMVVVSCCVFYANQALACEYLYTGNVVEDHFSSGKIKTLKSVTKVTNDFGDSTPLENILVKKSLLKSHKDLSVEVKILGENKKETSFQVFKNATVWTGDEQYLIFTDYDFEKLKQVVFKSITDDSAQQDKREQASHSPHGIILVLKQGSKVLCTKKLNIDNH